MDKFIFQINKEEQKNNIKLSLFSVNKKRETELEEIYVPYVIFIKKKDFEMLKINAPSVKVSKHIFKNKEGKDVLKIDIENKETFKYILNKIREEKIETYEEDISAERRYLIDNDISLATGDYGGIELKSLSIDIETIGNKEKQKIAMISCFSSGKDHFSKVYVDKQNLTNSGLDLIRKKRFAEFEVELAENEKEMLEKFRDDVILYGPQVIFGWNVVDFDFNVMRERMRELKVDFKFSKYEGECRLRVISDFFRESTMFCPGVLIFDAIHLLKMNFIGFEDYKLDTVAKAVLGKEKIVLEAGDDELGIEDKLKLIHKMVSDDPVKLINYNFVDSYLAFKIVEKLNLLGLVCQRSIISGTPVERVKSPITSLDIMYLKKLHKRGLVASSNFQFQETSPISGAYVIEPIKGFYNDIFVFDFKSLYPSIIMSFNIDPFSYSKNGKILAPNGVRFENKRGILPELILFLHKERERAKKENDKTKSFALKTTMNSFYGAMVSPRCRFYNKDVGEAITAFGREIIKTAKKFIEDLGHKVIYGDTDSIFVYSGRKFDSLGDKKKFGAEIEKKANDYFKNLIKGEYGQESFLHIEFEKIYSSFFIASKKRYVGFDEISKKIVFVGMEAVRGDWTELARNFQIKLVELIFEGKKKEDIKNFILDYVEKLKSREFDDLLVYKKKITKPLSNYIKTTPPHVKAARELKEIGGRLVKYVMTKKGPKHVSLVDKKVHYDYEHYIDKQLKGVSDDLLESFGIDFEDVLYGKKQNKLDKFF